MGEGGKYWDELEKTFGKGTLTSGFRSQKEQDDLRRQGKTRAARSAHTYNDGYDFNHRFAKSEQEIRAQLAAKGWEVDKVIYETGKGRNQGTGPHWHTEGMRRVGTPKTPNGIAVNTTQPGVGVANPSAFLDALGSKLAPESKASQNVQQNAQAIFGSDKEFRARAQKVEGELANQGATIDVLSQVTEAAQMQQAASMRQQVDETRAISKEIADGTQQLKQKVTPVFEARGRIADQLDRVNTMNPLERAFRGVFDLNYDRKYLEGQLDHYDRTLKARADDFNYMNDLHAKAMGEVERRYRLDNALPGLAVDQAKEDLGIVSMRLQQTVGMLGNLRDTIAGESQLISAKAAARDDMLSRLDGPTILDLANQAKSSGGVVAYNGAEFSYGELRDRLEKEEQQQLTMESVRMSIASGRMDMAEKYATNLARSLTRTQVEAAIASGGVYNGVQLPQDVLTQVYQGHISRAQTQAETAASTMPAAIALQAGSDSLNSMVGLFNRSSGLFGQQDHEQARVMLSNGTALIRQLVKATEEGQPPEVIAALTTQVAANTKRFQDSVDQTILSSVGGDKRAAGYVKAFTYGTPMDEATAAEAMTYFAVKGGLPKGIAASEEARAMFAQAQKLVELNRFTEKDKPRSAEDLQRIVTAELSKVARQTVGNARFNRLFNDLPAVAKQVGHPLGRMPVEDWNRARSAAEVEAASGLSKEIEVNQQEILQMARTGKPLNDTPESKEKFAKFEAAAGQFRSLEQINLGENLDDLPQVTPGRRNSSVLQDFLRSPQMSKFTSNYQQSLGGESMGDYLLNPISVGATESRIAQYGKEMQQAQLISAQTRKQTAREAAKQYGLVPQARILTILAGIDGIGAEGAAALKPFVIEATKNQLTYEGMQASREQAASMGSGLTAVLPPMNNVMVAQEQEFMSKLQSTKFDDPRLEAYRKVAIRGYKQTSTKIDDSWTTLWKVVTGDEW